MLAAPDLRNYTAAEWDTERVRILSFHKQTEPLSWIYRGFKVARSVTSTLNVAVNTWNQQIHHMMVVVGAPTVWLWWSHALFMSDGCDLCLSFCLWSSHQPVIWRSHWPHVSHAGMCPTSVWVGIHTHTHTHNPVKADISNPNCYSSWL